jgi:hypothetical protein
MITNPIFLKMKSTNIFLLCIFLALHLSCNTKNKLVINVSQSLEIKKAKVKFIAIEAGVNRTIFMNGKMIGDIEKSYGENEFIVSYDSLKVEFGHFKTNRNDVDNYDVLIYKNENKTLCRFNIKGIRNEYFCEIMK